MRNGGDNKCVEIFEQLCNTNFVPRDAECKALTEKLESEYNVSIVFVFDEAKQLLTHAPNTVTLTYDRNGKQTGSLFHAVYKKYSFINIVLIDTTLSFSALMDTVSKEGRKFLQPIIGTLSPWTVKDVRKMLDHYFQLFKETDSFQDILKKPIGYEFLLLCYLLSGSPEHTITFHRLLLENAVPYEHKTRFTEEEIIKLMLDSINMVPKYRKKAASKRIKDFLKEDKKEFKAKEVMLQLLFGVPLNIMPTLVFDPKVRDVMVEALIEQSIAPVISVGATHKFEIVDPIAYQAYFSEAFTLCTLDMWEHLAKMAHTTKRGEVFEWFMVLLLMQETVRLEGKPCTDSPLFSGLKGSDFDGYQLSVKSFLKDRLLNKDLLAEQNNIPGAWFCQFAGLFLDTFVKPDPQMRPDGIFFLNPINKGGSYIPVLVSMSVVSDPVNDSQQPHKAVHMFTSTGIDLIGKTTKNTISNLKYNAQRHMDPFHKNFDKYLRWMICPKMQFGTSYLSFMKQHIGQNPFYGVNEIFEPFDQEKCSLHVTENEATTSTIRECIQLYSKQDYYVHMEQIYRIIMQ